jgi:cytochrome bd-type quinol oxidase subunit 1
MNLDIPGFSAKGAIAFFGLFHTSVAALAIGLSFVVFVFQIVGYRKRIVRYDLFAKRTQLFHVCIYNIGTINAIGLVFALSGLYPQFWEQLFVHFFWPFVIEEALFLLLATTVTFHYFFWEKLWGHKKLHIFLGAMLIPLFFLQMYIINGIGGFMLTPGFAEGEVSLSRGILGWDPAVMYNPSFLMLQLHRSFATISYAGFFMAGWCGVRLYLTKSKQKVDYYEDCGRLAFYIAMAAFLSLPVIGYFYSWVLQFEAEDAFWNLMFGRGDIVVGGIDTWWLKHVFVAAMLGASLTYTGRTDRSTGPFSIPKVMIWAIAGFYFVFYMAMGMVMTWAFFVWMLVSAVASAFLTWHLLSYHKGSGRAVFLIMGILAFSTVMLGGYAREASRPRFVDRIAHYDNVYVPQERARFLMVPVDPDEIARLPAPPVAEEIGAAQLIRDRCTSCHTLDRVRGYAKDDWERIVKVMRVYGTKLNDEEAAKVTAHLEAGEPY